MRRIFGPKRDRVKGEWIRLHKVEPNDLYRSAYIFQVIKSRTDMGKACTAYRGREGVYRVLLGNPEGQRSL
jgi:hypothetical protein